jgi:hypothetical protein
VVAAGITTDTGGMEISPEEGDDGSPHTGTFRSKSVLSRVANAELAAGTENGLNER